jgi:hypothetical protein
MEPRLQPAISENTTYILSTVISWIVHITISVQLRLLPYRFTGVSDQWPNIIQPKSPKKKWKLGCNL